MALSLGIMVQKMFPGDTNFSGDSGHGHVDLFQSKQDNGVEDEEEL